jgi:hypothetical protein
LVFDDSTSQDQMRLCQETCAQMSAAADYSCQYIGASQKHRLSDHLVGGGEIPRSVVEFALFPDGDLIKTGANRNAIQLWTAGRKILSVDDDTICKTLLAPCAAISNTSDRLSLGGEGNPAEFWFFADHQAAVEAAQCTELDIIKRHEEFLGRSLSDMLPVANVKAHTMDAQGACAHMRRSISSGTGRVVVTSNGCAGHSGMSSGAGLRRHRGRGTRQRLTASESIYRMAVQSRQVIAQSLTATICHGPPFSTMFTGLDNRFMLPPFLPVCRNQDGVFAYCVQRCFPDSYFAYLPWALVHQPPGDVKRGASSAAELRLSDVVISLASGWSMPDGDLPGERLLQSLGVYLTQTALLRPHDFREVLRLAASTRASHVIAHLEYLLDEFKYAPSYWASDMQTDITALQQAAAGRGFGLPSDLAERGEAETLARTQNIVCQFGELLYWWPAMFERAQTFHPSLTSRQAATVIYWL